MALNQEEDVPMHDPRLSFDHIHLISEDPERAARWYCDILGAEVKASYELRGAPQINVRVGTTTIIIRGNRPGEDPSAPRGMRHFGDYSSHDEWGVDHFGFRFRGDLRAFCEEIREKGAEFAVEPWEFSPGSLLCYLAAPDGVSIELVQV